MKIAVNTRLLVPEKMDGIGRFTYETLCRLAERRKEDNFVFIFDRTPPHQFKFPQNVSCVKLSPQARHPILWVIWFEYVLKNYINQNNFDLFISPEGWVPPKLNCRSIGVIHDLNFEHFPENIIFSHRKYLKYFFPKFARRASRIATVSEFSKNDIIQSYSISSDAIDVVYNGANEIFKPISENDKKAIKQKFTKGENFFLFVGTIHPRKNLENILLAFDHFKKESNSKTKLLIAGNRKWFPKKLKAIFDSMEYKSEIIFTGRLDDDELAKCYSAATGLTYTPYFEGFGIPILEAMQCETAIITSNVSSMPEVAGEAAILCEPTKFIEIGDAMLLIENDSKKRIELIQKGKIQRQSYSWEKTTNLLNSCIENTINNNA